MLDTSLNLRSDFFESFNCLEKFCILVSTFTCFINWTKHSIRHFDDTSKTLPTIYLTLHKGSHNQRLECKTATCSVCLLISLPKKFHIQYRRNIANLNMEWTLLKILSRSLPLTNFRCSGFPLINEFKDLGPSTQLMRWEAAFHLLKGLSNGLEDLSNWSQPGLGI